MSYDGKLMSRALKRFEEDKQQRELEFRRRENELLRRIPRLAEIRDELRGTMAQIMSRALKKGADVERAIAAIREENLALQTKEQHS